MAFDFLKVNWARPKRSSSRSGQPSLYMHKKGAMSDTALSSYATRPDDFQRFPLGSRAPQPMPVLPQMAQPRAMPRPQVNYQAVPQVNYAPMPQQLFPRMPSQQPSYVRAPSPAPFIPSPQPMPRRRTASDASSHPPDPNFLRTLRKSKEPPTMGNIARPQPQRPTRPNIIKFYEKGQPYYGFTNFSPHPIEYNGKEWPTSEHLFQAWKFMEHRPGLAEHIRTASDRSGVAFSEARRFAPEMRQDWHEINIDVMDEILELKFQQHRALRRDLLNTGDAYLIEDAGKNDAFWGNGADGRGRNELGHALMRLREKLRRQ